jgi:hypothetical protein
LRFAKPVSMRTASPTATSIVPVRSNWNSLTRTSGSSTSNAPPGLDDRRNRANREDVGRRRIIDAYAEAIRAGDRFCSSGDASFLEW